MKKFVLFTCLFVVATDIYAQTIDTFTVIQHSRIYYHQAGHGKPAVIFVSGLGEDHNTWADVQDSIARFATTISYDRAGLGKSEYHGEKKDVRTVATELHALTDAIRIPKPFILVGHSLGCQIVKEYAALYPSTVAGIVFLDPGYNERKLQARVPDSVWQQREAALRKYIPHFNTAQQAEQKQANESSAASDRIKALPKVPIVLFTATHINPDFPASATEFQVKRETHLLWLRSLPWATHIETSLSRHYIQNDAPQLVIDAVRNMVQRVRKAT
jgi:pimeloyl-ACP methyl ester carboxylesterase